MATGRIPTTANSPLTAKGDLFTFSTGSAKLAVGSNGDTLVADSAATTGLRWTENYAAGKNKIINGDFFWNQRNFSSTTTSGTYGFDRWLFTNVGGTGTYSAQTFTLGAAPVAGYEGKNFASVQTSGQSAVGDVTIFRQYIESVRTFAGQTVTVSFWAKSASGTPKVAVELAQTFGTGGSGSSDVTTYLGQATLSTSWTRFSFTVALPSIAGKTFGANPDDTLRLNLFASAGSNFDARTGTLGIQTNTFSFWGAQVEAGSVATAFQTATGTIQGELAACQRYYWRSSNTETFARHGNGAFGSTTSGFVIVAHPVPMRIAPTSIDFSSLLLYDYNGDFAVTNLTQTTNCRSSIMSLVTATIASGGTQYRPIQLNNNNTTSGYVGFSAEL
jgi:hypothetical protein